jgi:hypothetical protein
MTMSSPPARPLCGCCGQPMPRIAATCDCGHSVTAHNIPDSSRADRRTKCTVSDRTGSCGCLLYVEATPERYGPLPGTPAAEREPRR